jgi:hypothetical protein
MTDDFVSEPHPTGALVPVPESSSTTLTAAGRRPFLESERAAARRGVLRDLVRTTFDTLDALGDTIAGAVGLR